jgi:hypothetical protein
MSISIDKQILTKFKKARMGTLLFIDDFLIFGNYKAISKALERLVTKKDIIRIARGIYSRPVIDSILGEVKPSSEEIAKAIAKKERARIIPSGSIALNALGLSSQVPMNVVYLTDGSPRKISIGKRSILFKKTSAKNLILRGEISSLAILALKEIGNGNLTKDEEQIILNHLQKEDSNRLKHDIRFAPEWIRKIMRKALNSVE